MLAHRTRTALYALGTLTLAFLISASCVYFTNNADDGTVAVDGEFAGQAEPVTADEAMMWFTHSAEVERFVTIKLTVDEDQWWTQAAINEWNAAIGRNWIAAKAYLDEQAAKRPAPRRASGGGGGGTYSGNASGSVNGYPCGGDLPPCYVLKRESGGNPGAENPVSSASGLWQFIDGTWNGYGGYSHASDAPPEVQNEKARLTYAGGAGAGHWACC